MRKIAVVLFNLGGPDCPEAVEPFLFNLFSDPRILSVPGFIRPWLAKTIARKRAPVARAIYDRIGGRSPLLPNTQAQAEALTAALRQKLPEGDDARCFIAMRYWRPRCADIMAELAAYAPDVMVALPLYPQFSTTTTASSLAEFRDALKDFPALQAMPLHEPCCYPEMQGFVTAMAQAARPVYEQALSHGKPRLLLSAHGLPEKVVKAGDPYQWQCEQTARAFIKEFGLPDVDWLNCYQSRVGPLRWIGPSTEDEIRRAGADKAPVVVVPIAFVSEHSETLVELDIEYRELATHSGVPFYGRVPTVGAMPDFIAGLAGLVSDVLAKPPGTPCPQGQRLCPAKFKACPCAA